MDGGMVDSLVVTRESFLVGWKVEGLASLMEQW